MLEILTSSTILYDLFSRSSPPLGHYQFSTKIHVLQGNTRVVWISLDSVIIVIYGKVVKTMGKDEWLTDEDFAALQTPVDPAGKYEAVTAALLRKHASHAAQTVIDIAMNSENDNTRLKAAQYIIDRTLGRVGEERNRDEDGRAPWEKVFDSVLVEPPAEQRALGKAIEPYKH